MQVQVRELETGMARRVRAAQESLTATVGEQRALEPIWSLFSLACAFLVVALYIVVCFRVGGAIALFLFLLTPGILLAAMHFPRALTARHVGAPTLRALLSEPTLPRVERLYSEMLLVLLETPVQRPAPLKELLREVNTLVQTDRAMAAQQARLQAVVDPLALGRVADEYQQLTVRLSQEGDPIARAALSESLALCRERQEHLQALPLLLHRLEAQRELLSQGVALAHAALLRTRTAPLALAPPELTTLRTRVRELTSESQALEEATRSLHEL